MDFASLLRAHMDENNLRLEHIALAGNCSVQSVRGYLTGHRKPAYDTIHALRRAYPDLAAMIDKDVSARQVAYTGASSNVPRVAV